MPTGSRDATDGGGSEAAGSAWPCPLCGRVGRATGQLTADEVASRFCPPARDAARTARMRRVLGMLWSGSVCTLRSCEACGLGYADPRLAGDGAFYELLHERTGYPCSRWEFSFFARSIERQHAVLDVGAGEGAFLESLGAERRVGIEASESMCDRLRAKGFEAATSLELTEGLFDRVSLFHVIQYAGDPLGWMKQISGRMKMGGRLAISVPDGRATGGLSDISTPPHPLTRWTRESLVCLVERSGLEVVEVVWIPQRFSSLMWHAHASTRARAARRPGSLAGRVDGLAKSRFRTALLTILAMGPLLGLLPRARRLVSRSQVLVIAEKRPIREAM